MIEQLERVTYAEADGTRFRYKVLLDGQDVTRACFEADQIRGFVRLYAPPPQGRRIERQGDVRILREPRA